MNTPLIRRRVLQSGLALTLTMAFVPLTALAQSGGSYRTIARYKVAPGRAPEFQSAIKDYHDIFRKAGHAKATTVWQSASGENEYVMVTYHDSISELDTRRSSDPKLKDAQAELARAILRRNNCVESATLVIDRVETDLSLPRSTEPPQMIRSLRTVVRPERLNDYLALLKSELMPAVKSSGVTSFTTTRARFGALSTEMRSTMGIKNWAEAEASPVVKAMGPEKYQQFLAKSRAMVRESEVNVYRYRADLSYIPASSGAGGN